MVAGFAGSGLCIVVVVVGGCSWLLASCYCFKGEREREREREREKDIYV